MWGNRINHLCTDTFGTNFEWSYNINLNGVDGDCTYDPANILVSSWLGTVSVTKNLVANVTNPILPTWSAFGHATQIAATEADIKLSADKLTLQPSSPYAGMGIGANLSCFNEAAVRAGTPSALCPLPPEVQAAGALPLVTITSPTSSPSYNASSGTIALAGTASSNAGITQVTWATDRGGSGSASGATNWTISGLVLALGTTVVTVTARDPAGNVGSQTLSVTFQGSGSTVSCDLNNDGHTNVVDVQLATNQALGYAACSSADLNADGHCTIVDVQRIISASLGAACNLGP
jgi:hypothetical protein